MEKDDRKKQKLNPQDEGDAYVYITTDDSSQKKEESQLEEENTQKLNEPLDSERCQNSFMEYQGEEHIIKKLNRPLQPYDDVILLKNIPEANLYKGYLCVIDYIEITAKNPEDSLYHIFFSSQFDPDDKSRQSIGRFKEFKFSSSFEDSYVYGKDILRVETQDLRYRTHFE